MVKKRKRASLYPKRIAGISFSEDDYNRIQEICAEHNISEAQVVRDAVATGLTLHEGDLRNKVIHAMVTLGAPESTVIRGAIEEGLEEFSRMYRSHKRFRMLQELREELGTDDESLKMALQDYLQKNSRLEKLIDEEEFFQKTIDKEDEQQEEEDQERQQEVDECLGRETKDNPPDPT